MAPALSSSSPSDASDRRTWLGARTTSPLPRRASPDARVVVRVYFLSGLTIEERGRAELARIIHRSGYRLESAASAADAIATNVTEPDLAFEALCARVPACDGASVVLGLVDAAFDVKHDALEGKLWTNPGEIPGNGDDDDGNGYVDDVSGYNVQFSRRTSVTGVTTRWATTPTAPTSPRSRRAGPRACASCRAPRRTR